MAEAVVAWDLETIPDEEDQAAARKFADDAADDPRTDEPRQFPKLVYHKIICIGALIAMRTPRGWHAKSVGAPHIGERSERELLQTFVDRLAELKPRLVTYNGTSFDLPVLRFRALKYGISAPVLSSRAYFNRYTDDALDLCDLLSSFDRRAKVSLHELSRVLGFSGKPEGIDGTQVERFYRDGRLREIAWYCESDVINTYRIWLRYELFRGTLTTEQYEYSDQNVFKLAQTRRNSPH